MIGRINQHTQRRFECDTTRLQRIVDDGQRTEGGHSLDHAMELPRSTGAVDGHVERIDPGLQRRIDAVAEFDRKRGVAQIENAHAHRLEVDAARAAWS